MMTRAMIYVVLVALLALTGCLEPLEVGLVVAKHFIPAHTETSFKTITVDKTTVTIPDNKYIPDKWFITISGINEQAGMTATMEVVESTWSNVTIGDYYRVGADRGSRDPESG